MQVLEAIEGRSSAKKFSDQGVPASTVESLLRCAARAPDHGLLAPWRFVVLLDEGREVFAAALESALRRRHPEADAETVSRERSKAFRSPVLIVVATTISPHPKVPDVEQVLAVGAAVENLILAARATGLGTMWKTGGAAYDPAVKSTLGLDESDQIAGFIHVGWPTEMKPVRTADITAVTRWIVSAGALNSR